MILLSCLKLSIDPFEVAKSPIFGFNSFIIKPLHIHF
jgi:hypothetical protein